MRCQVEPPFISCWPFAPKFLNCKLFNPESVGVVLGVLRFVFTAILLEFHKTIKIERFWRYLVAGDGNEPLFSARQFKIANKINGFRRFFPSDGSGYFFLKNY